MDDVSRSGQKIEIGRFGRNLGVDVPCRALFDGAASRAVDACLRTEFG